MPRKTHDPFQAVFDSFMNRIEERIHDYADKLMEVAEQEADRLINRTATRAASLGSSREPAQPRRRPQGSKAKAGVAKAAPRFMPTAYDILEVSPRASQETIEAAYKSLAKRFHPDLFPDPKEKQRMGDRMKFISVAHDVLKDPEKRRAYDRALR